MRCRPETWLYCCKSGVEEAQVALTQYAKELKESLISKHRVEIEGFGTLVMNDNYSISFIADPTLNIYDEGFMLEPIMLDPIEQTSNMSSNIDIVEIVESEEEGEEVFQDFSQLQEDILSKEEKKETETNNTTSNENEVQEEVKEEVKKDEKEIEVVEESEESEESEEVKEPETKESKPAEKKKISRLWIYILIVAVIILIALYLLWGYIEPALYNLLYSKEELEVIKNFNNL